MIYIIIFFLSLFGLIGLIVVLGSNQGTKLVAKTKTELDENKPMSEEEINQKIDILTVIAPSEEGRDLVKRLRSLKNAST